MVLPTLVGGGPHPSAIFAPLLGYSYNISSLFLRIYPAYLSLYYDITIHGNVDQI